MERVRKAVGESGEAMRLDVTDRRSVEEFVRAIEKRHKHIDILVNNAGGALTPAERSHASVTPEEDTRLLMDVNFMSTLHCCQAVAPLTIERLFAAHDSDQEQQQSERDDPEREPV